MCNIGPRKKLHSAVCMREKEKDCYQHVTTLKYMLTEAVKLL